MNFWQLLRLIGIVLFLAIVLAGVFGVERGQPSGTGSDPDIRIAPILVR